MVSIYCACARGDFLESDVLEVLCADLKRTVFTSSENVVIICPKMAAFSTVDLELICCSLKKATAVEQKTAKGQVLFSAPFSFCFQLDCC